jgi:hypothetical protein
MKISQLLNEARGKYKQGWGLIIQVYGYLGIEEADASYFELYLNPTDFIQALATKYKEQLTAMPPEGPPLKFADLHDDPDVSNEFARIEGNKSDPHWMTMNINSFTKFSQLEALPYWDWFQDYFGYISNFGVLGESRIALRFNG